MSEEFLLSWITHTSLTDEMLDSFGREIAMH